MNFEFNTLTLLILFGIGAVGLLFCHSRLSETAREIRETSARLQENLDRRVNEAQDRLSSETRALRDSVLSLGERMTRIQDEVSDTLEEARKRILQEAESGKDDQEKRLTFFGNLVESTRKELLAGLEESSRKSAEQNGQTQESLKPLVLEMNRLSSVTRELPQDTGERLRAVEKLFQEQSLRLSSFEEALLRDRRDLQGISSELVAQFGALERDLRTHFESRFNEFYQQVGGVLQKSDDLDRQIKAMSETLRESVRENIQVAAGRVFALIGKASEEALAEDAFSPKPRTAPPPEAKTGVKRYSYLFRK
jgi:gas vesicle protein